ncbi:MAG: PAS domain S-box protein, partial [Candidatus Competibacter sp.]|nr:PAS domain S-box protein [Candidatus Competibacter sp.]
MSEHPLVKSIDILLVEDNAGDADFIEKRLLMDGSTAFAIERAPRLAVALERIGANRFDVVLLDLELPDSDGLDTLRAMRRAADTPVVVLTDNDDERLGLAAIQEGAQDYVVKGQISGALLSRVLRYALERHRSAQRLRESEQKFRGLFDKMAEGVALHEIVHDDRGHAVEYRIIDVNPAYERHTGLAPSAVRGRLATEIYGVKAPFLEAYERVARTHEPVSFEAFFEPLNRHYSISAFVLEQGFFATVFEDVTERGRAGQLLQATVERFYAILSNLYAGVLLVTNESRVEFANQAFCDLFDLENSPAELTGLTAAEMIERIGDVYLHPDEAVARIREIVGRGEPVRGEEVAMRGGRTFLRDFIPISLDGKLYGRLWHHLDISERKQAEAALREMERKYREIFETSPVGLYQSTPEGRYIDVNPAFARILGYSTPDEIVREISDIGAQLYANPGDRETLTRQVAERGEVRGFEAEAKRRDGQVIWVSIDAVAVRDAVGAIRMYQGAITDITE